MKYTPSTEITVLQRPVAVHKVNKMRIFASAALAVGMAATIAVPAYAAPSGEIDAVSYALRTGQLQAIDAADYFVEQPLANLDLEYALPAPQIEQPVAASEGASVARTIQSVDIPAGSGGEGMVAAALAQLGVAQDCTDLVQNSLAAVGLTKRRDQGGYDLGTGVWDYARFGTQVSLEELAPGDILIYGHASSGAHVAIYIGNGQAVHGGYNGNTVIAGVHGLYVPLTAAVRID